MLIKTRGSLFEEVALEVKNLHPYEVPEIVALPAVNVNKPYMDWMLESTKSQPTAQQ